MQHDFTDLDSMFSRYRSSKEDELAEIERAFELERAQFKSKQTRFESQLAAKSSELRECSDHSHKLQLQIEVSSRACTTRPSRGIRSTADIATEIDRNREWSARKQRAIKQSRSRYDFCHYSWCSIPAFCSLCCLQTWSKSSRRRRRCDRRCST